MQSGIVLQYKKVRFHKKQPNKNLMRKSALFRKKAATEREYLKKIGRLPEEDMTRGRRH